MTYIADGQLEHLRDVMAIPELVAGRYEIGERIGAGGMGDVYRAFDRSLGRAVALKVLSIPDDSGQLELRVMAEARITARLEHPSIVPVHDVGKLDDGRVYYVMKYVQGKRLDRFFKPELAYQEKLRMLQRVCEAVAFAHAQGIIHRDLKPENIMVGPFGEVLVMDWGVAKLLEAANPAPSAERLRDALDSNQTSPGTVVGTPGYMAPEQEMGGADVDQRADVYGLGAVLFHMLTGQAPGKHLAGQGNVDRSIPRQVEAICLKAMAPAREARYQTVSALAQDVAWALEGEPVSAYHESIWERLMRMARKHQFIILLLGAYLLVRIFLYIFRIR